MPARRGKQSDPATVVAPTPASVPGNLWTEIDLGATGEQSRSVSVSVVIEGEPAASERVSASRKGLAEQTYDPDLIEVIAPGEERAPEGEVLVFLEAGVVPEPTLVEAHARWHTTVSDAVSVGPVRSADGGDPLGLLRDLTQDLTEWDPALFRAAALGNLAVRAETLRGIGEDPEIGDERLRRLDRAYRLACWGVVFAVEEAAAARTEATSGIADLARIDPRLANRLPLTVVDAEAEALLPVPPFRGVASPRRFRRPAMVVNLDAGGAPAADVTTAVDAVLGGPFGDLELCLQVPDDHAERDTIAAAVDRDPRVRLAPPSIGGFCESPLQVVLPGIAMPDPRTMADLCELIVAERIGAVHATIPGAPPHEAMAEVLVTGALARARRLAEHTGEAWDELLGRLYGERWTSGVEVSMRRHGIDEAQITEHGPLAAASDLEHERAQHLRFRDRADDLAERASIDNERAVRACLSAREARQVAERLEARLAAAGPPPRYWRLRPLRTFAGRLRRRPRKG